MDAIPESSSSAVTYTNNIITNDNTTTINNTPNKTMNNSQSLPVDRKRRDNINERIQELLTLIPSEYFQEYYATSNNSSSNSATPGAISGAHSGGGAGSSNSEDSTVGTPISSFGTPKPKGTGTRDGRPNKGQILTQAVEYINKLQNQVDAKNREEVECILKLSKLAKIAGVKVTDINLENTSAEIELGRIGVGPLGGSTTS